MPFLREQRCLFGHTQLLHFPPKQTQRMAASEKSPTSLKTMGFSKCSPPSPKTYHVSVAGQFCLLQFDRSNGRISNIGACNTANSSPNVNPTDETNSIPIYAAIRVIGTDEEQKIEDIRFNCSSHSERTLDVSAECALSAKYFYFCVGIVMFLKH